MKKILICLFVAVILSACSNTTINEPEQTVVPEQSNSIKNYDKSLTEGVLLEVGESEIKIRDVDDEVEKTFPAVEKVISDITALEIGIGDRVIIKVDDGGTAIQIEKVL